MVRHLSEAMQLGGAYEDAAGVGAGAGAGSDDDGGDDGAARWRPRRLQQHRQVDVDDEMMIVVAVIFELQHPACRR